MGHVRRGRCTCNNSAPEHQGKLIVIIIIIRRIITMIIIMIMMMMIIIIIIIALKGAGRHCFQSAHCAANCLAVRDCFQSAHCAANCLQYVRLSDPGVVVCKSRAAHRATCRVPRGTKGQLSYEV